jgi:hypothetical protein
MTDDRVAPRTVALGAAASVVVGAAWVWLALRQPTVTYHFAPGVVAVTWAGALAWSGRPVDRSARILATAGGAAIALAVGFGLHARHALEGPTLVHRGSALAEVVAVVVMATPAAWVWLRRARPR